jgi:RNA polymerase sigma-19 factor, ECF subfamily
MAPSWPHDASGEETTSQTSESERDRIARIRAGDEAEFQALFEEHYDSLCRYVANFLGNRDSAEDVVQGVFARIWQERARWAVVDIKHYLYAAVRRRAVSEFRRDSVRKRAAPFLTIETGMQGNPSAADAEFEAEELRRRFERALAALPARTREAFVLSRNEGQNYVEVALRMGISQKTVGVHIANALAALRKALGLGKVPTSD